MFRALCTHHQEVKIVLYSVWYHHTETNGWSKITKMQFYKYEHIVLKFMYEFIHKFYYYMLIGNYVYTRSALKRVLKELCVSKRDETTGD